MRQCAERHEHTDLRLCPQEALLVGLALSLHLGLIEDSHHSIYTQLCAQTRCFRPKIWFFPQESGIVVFKAESV